MIRFFFFNDTATTEIYTLSLHDALPIFVLETTHNNCKDTLCCHPEAQLKELIIVPSITFNKVKPHCTLRPQRVHPLFPDRSEEHTSELQSRQYLVCRLLLEKKIYCPIPS